MSKQGSNQSFWEIFHGPNMGYIEEQFEQYENDPSAVDPSLREIFEEHGAPDWMESAPASAVETNGKAAPSGLDVAKISSALKLVEAIRRHGHLHANIYAVGSDERPSTNLLELETYGLKEQDLKEMPAEWVWPDSPIKLDNALQVVRTLKERYAGTISFEFGHVNNEDERKWLLDKVDTGSYQASLSKEEKKQLLHRLAEVEGFENFLAKTFVAQKRFSIEGLDVMVPMLDHIIQSASLDRIKNIMMGMAHRGRLNVLAHILGKPYDKIFSEFHHSPDKELMPSEGSMGINYGWTGDVKYHFGARREIENGEQSATRVTLSHNPSHLEYVNPVVEGFTRAAQDDRSEPGYPEMDQDEAVGLLIHGDAAFIGEGVVAETLNMSDLPGYRTGGTVHIIANNLIGFTTNRKDGRSTRYASDLAKGFEIPVVHVNADDPIACLSAMTFAYEYRKKFHKDFLIDLVGYRRFGHNEMDEPRSTQPKLYKEIDDHATVAEIFEKQLQGEAIVEEGTLAGMKEEFEQKLRDIYNNMGEHETTSPDVKDRPSGVERDLDEIQTAIGRDRLTSLNEGLLKRPEGFNGFKKLEKILQRRAKMLDDGQKVDWATAEALAFASILEDGTPIRITGQDTERGTFAHRHLVLHDVETGETYCPLHGLEQAKASFDIHNSPLSEAGVIGFEYGYSVQAPEALVLWEAQFGDFANAGQVIFDQFISAGRAKWGEKSSMVFLLPHGYEGQGPEHSSARLERFLQLAAENNWTVANVTSSAQYFHLLRRQAAISNEEEARPLVLMTPKSLLRNQRVAVGSQQFVDGHFQSIMKQPLLSENKDKKKVKTLLLGSGKIMVDIEDKVENSDESFETIDAVRIEQIYPFPEKHLAEMLETYPNLEELVWVQEEPQNMGSWYFVEGILYKLLKEGQIHRYVGRPHRASPSVGEPNIHKTEQNRIIHEALQISKGGNTK
ncbi:2-oxoglutarate dehydrogenase E1 component [Halobacillus sp. ACCC02827]|uniref:2-oxoglutarate dehydrogenase E1 component n=2 Tax=Bacillales TaxID=1385 RepID=UPI0002A4D2D5|nr:MULTISPECIES: 2-oxoglutarate dehydrogenase E1 component [unclassified Halobacillus]ELK47571.1 2-oxoglutarate dehydrogenase [Halobacillus sp. BAB-2008]QHT45887.1 2-oxoglutarate dehydrogenase E1 component [Bacillus sp. SB49]WJE16693.1 2-oxoglutarate dehydrogenase E1 component [Halobacillus sp. ACCC02827]